MKFLAIYFLELFEGGACDDIKKGNHGSLMSDIVIEIIVAVWGRELELVTRYAQ